MRLFVLLVVVLGASRLACAAPDAAEGGRLVADKKCETCHHNKTLGEASAIYLRKDRKVTSIAKLKAQVALCNSELNLQLFPDEEEHIVAFLDQAFYRFSAKAPRAP